MVLRPAFAALAAAAALSACGALAQDDIVSMIQRGAGNTVTADDVVSVPSRKTNLKNVSWPSASEVVNELRASFTKVFGRTKKALDDKAAADRKYIERLRNLTAARRQEGHAIAMLQRGAEETDSADDTDSVPPPKPNQKKIALPSASKVAKEFGTSFTKVFGLGKRAAGHGAAAAKNSTRTAGSHRKGGAVSMLQRGAEDTDSADDTDLVPPPKPNQKKIALPSASKVAKEFGTSFTKVFRLGKKGAGRGAAAAKNSTHKAAARRKGGAVSMLQRGAEDTDSADDADSVPPAKPNRKKIDTPSASQVVKEFGTSFAKVFGLGKRAAGRGAAAAKNSTHTAAARRKDGAVSMLQRGAEDGAVSMLQRGAEDDDAVTERPAKSSRKKGSVPSASEVVQEFRKSALRVFGSSKKPTDGEVAAGKKRGRKPRNSTAAAGKKHNHTRKNSTGATRVRRQDPAALV